MSGLDITGGRVLDPGRGIDATATVSIADGIITGVEVAGGAVSTGGAVSGRGGVTGRGRGGRDGAGPPAPPRVLPGPGRERAGTARGLSSYDFA